MKIRVTLANGAVRTLEGDGQVKGSITTVARTFNTAAGVLSYCDAAGNGYSFAPHAWTSVTTEPTPEEDTNVNSRS